MQHRIPLLAALALMLASLFWAGNAVVGRGVIELIPPMALSFWRWVVAFLVILPFALPRIQQSAPTLRANWGKLFVLAFLSTTMFNTLLYIAAHTTTAINISLINALMPIGIGIMAYVALGSRLSRNQLLGLLVAMPGVVMIITEGRLSVLLGLQFRPGDLLMITAVMSWAIYTVLLQRFQIRLDPLVLLTALIAMALPITLAFYVIEWFLLRQPFTPSREVILAILYVGIFPSLGSYLGWNYGVTAMGSNRAAMFIYLLPVFSAALSITFLGERLYTYHAVGALLLLIGLYLSTWADARARRKRYGPTP